MHGLIYHLTMLYQTYIINDVRSPALFVHVSGPQI